VTRLFNVLLQVLVLRSGVEGAATIRSVMHVAGTDALLTRGGVGAGHPEIRVDVTTAGCIVNVVDIGGRRMVRGVHVIRGMSCRIGVRAVLWSGKGSTTRPAHFAQFVELSEMTHSVAVLLFEAELLAQEQVRAR
jgi:hypothetical protein